jgi:hypothetical protein
MSDPEKPHLRDNPWGPFASDPWSPLLDPVTGPVWDAAVASARERRLAAQRMAESQKRPHYKWPDELEADEKRIKPAGD